MLFILLNDQWITFIWSILIISFVFVFQHLGSQDDIALKIKNDTHVKIDAMNKQVAHNKDAVSGGHVSL